MLYGGVERVNELEQMQACGEATGLSLSLAHMSLMILVGLGYLTVGPTGMELQLDLESKLLEHTGLKDTIYLAARERTKIFGDTKMSPAPFGRQAPWLFRRDNVGSFRLRHTMHSAQTRLAVR